MGMQTLAINEFQPNVQSVVVGRRNIITTTIVMMTRTNLRFAIRLVGWWFLLLDGHGGLVSSFVNGWTTAVAGPSFARALATPGGGIFPTCRNRQTLSAATRAPIDFQSSEAYGRGEEHLTAALQEGDVVVFQTGTWYVDGVAVGNGQPAAWEYCLVDTIQIVWSHNCEHGVVRGFALDAKNSDDNDDQGTTGTLLQVADFDSMIDFGPEQLVARIPVEQQTEGTFRSLVELSDDLWRLASKEES